MLALLAMVPLADGEFVVVTEIVSAFGQPFGHATNGGRGWLSGFLRRRGRRSRLDAGGGRKCVRLGADQRAPNQAAGEAGVGGVVFLKVLAGSTRFDGDGGGVGGSRRVGGAGDGRSAGGGIGGCLWGRGWGQRARCVVVALVATLQCSDGIKFAVNSGCEIDKW